MKKSKKKTPKKPTYKLTLTLGDEMVRGFGETMLEALESTPMPPKIFHKGILIINDGTRRLETTLVVPRVKRLFFKSAQPLLAKQLEYLMR